MSPRLTLLAVCAALAGCRAPADASVVLDLSNALPGLRAPAATLDVVDEDGAAVPVEVVVPRERDGRDERVLVDTPLPVACDADGLCSANVRVRPGNVTFTMHVTAADRCGARAEIVRLSSDPIELQPYEAPFVELGGADFAHDDDDDGIVNVLEASTCGRFDVNDGALPPQACVGLDGAPGTDDDDADPCCAGVSPLEGRMTSFGGAHVLADGTAVEVAPFALDATEATWGQLARCVAAGACLANQPEHPARAALDGADPRAPVVGLVPSEAAALCAFFGKRLPLDVEWDLAAARRPGVGGAPDARARYPWDGDDVVTCNEGAGVAANFSLAGQSCAGAPLPVGSYPSSFANVDGARGAGVPLADLGGNVAEWTVVKDGAGDAPAIEEVPAGTRAVVLRGGGALSPLTLLENDVPVRAPLPASGDVQQWRDTIRRLASAAGVRCAMDVDDAAAPPALEEEPACE